MFTKFGNGPILPRKENTFYSMYTANPDILEFHNQLFFYFRGQGASRHDQVGVATTTKEKFDGIHWDTIHPEPVLRVSSDPDGYDNNHILDPATMVWDGKVYLYYSSHSLQLPHVVSVSVSLAVSEDGIHFTKREANPIIPDAVVPEVVIKDGKVYLFYQRWTEGSEGVSKLYVCTSEDGIHFDTSTEKLIMEPEAGCHSISTNRIFEENGWYYSFHGLNEKHKDYPESIGLARSQDLYHWEKSSKIVISRGEPGSWDEGALWFATVYKDKGRYYLWYEGTGTGNGRTTPEAIAASDRARAESYSGYGTTSFSQIGLATFDGNLKDYF